MILRKIILAGLAGGLVDFLLGWLIYGMLFPEHFTDEMPNVPFILMGCLTFGFFLSYIFVHLAKLSTYVVGLKVGATIGLMMALMSNFFKRAVSLDVDYETFGLDVLIGIVMGAIVGAVVAKVNGTLGKD